MKINQKRLLDTLHTLQEFTDTPEEGVTRFSYGVQDARVREYILKRTLEAGCTVSIDALQNIRIGLNANADGKKIVMAGSHIDTVRNGGWLDGIYGVCGALEVLETLTEYLNENPKAAAKLTANYEVVIFAEEEGSNFGSTMTGSKFITGMYTEADLDKLKNDTGKTLKRVLETLPEKSPGADVPDPYCRNSFSDDCVGWDFDTIKTMLELHIEQGPVLDREGLSIGIVDTIFGMRVIEVTLTGVGNHAGATPMSERYDALCTASKCILAAEALVKSDPDHCTVVTIGKMELAPNCSNVIPETVKFSLEVRDKDNGKINGFMDKIIDRIQEIARNRSVECCITEHSKSNPLQLATRLIDGMTQQARTQSIPHKVMNSGAVHDACMIANFVDTGMIFVPSIDGRSHVPEENTNESDLITGVQFLLDTILTEVF